MVIWYESYVSLLALSLREASSGYASFESFQSERAFCEMLRHMLDMPQ